MFFDRISFKIAAWYSIAFIFSAFVLFGLTAFLLLNSLEEKDRHLLTEKINEYALIYARDGLPGVQHRISSKEVRNSHDFIVRLSDANGKTFFLHVPERLDDENALQHQDVESFLSNVPRDLSWITIPTDHFGDDIEMASRKLPSGAVLQVGKDTEDREAFFHSFTKAYFKGLIPIFILAIVTGGLLSNRLLQPIRWLTHTVESIRSGKSKVRVPLRKNKDELWQLGSLFNKMLERNENLLQSMIDTVDNVAHDLRTPIMRLQNSAEEALSGKPDIKIFQDALIDCKENSDLILKLVNTIMDISEAEAGTLRFKKENISSSELIDAVIDLYGFVAEEKNIILQPFKTHLFHIEVDRFRIVQVLSNLVDNAIKYSPDGSSVEIVSEVSDGYGVISVIDRGCGVSVEELPRIWDRLYRGDASRSSRGLGLGLSLVRAITVSHGGFVNAYSNPNGIGTTFSIKFKVS